MGANICMNEACRTTTSLEWKKGWVLKSGGWATLCQTCGIAYENLVFCDTFHLEEAGWRECRICGKRLHCGCVASKFLHECLDFGGVGCVKCAKRLESRSIRPTQILGDEIPNVTLPEIVQSAIANGSGRKFDAAGLMQMANAMDINGPRQLFLPQKDNTIASLGQMKGKEIIPYAEVNECFNNFNQPSGGSSMFVSPEQIRSKQGVKDMFESLAQPSLNFSLSTPMSSSTSMLPFPGGVAEGSEQNKASGSQQGQPARHILPKPPKPGQTTSSEPNKGFVTKIRVARPPAEGRGRHQLLPRYWPRITDQEIQQISGDLKSTISPLFEKILSASDAGRIGRLVLPKACAEAYFPTINQSEGVPIKIQDVKGKEWTFQFRFWPNNNSRMYVLEGVTPCIQNMQLQAGDTVTFSRIEPSGQLVMGFRKANIGDAPDAQTMLVPIRGSSGETSVSGASDNMVTNVSRASETEKKKTRNIGPKNKRLLMHNDDANEVRVTWEEAQELLRPAPNAKPTVVTIDGFEIEEYDEPPVFGKKTVFTALASGEQEQWAECDSCSKWRKLPVHVLLPAKWTCAENVWDSKRSSCSAPDDITAKELDALNRASKDFKRSKMGESSKVVEDSEPTGLDALATAAVLGDNVVNMVEPSSDRPTTRHPRHRVGCSCIVCIQPPSGKNKHHPSCKCNVCILVKRRFKTLMQRRKRQQQEQQQQRVLKRSAEMKGTGTAAAAGHGHGHAVLQPINRASDRERSLSLVNGRKMEVGESSSKGQLDLNCHPSREDDMLAEAAAGMNLTSLMNAAGIPLDVYLKQNAVPNLSYNLLPNAAAAAAGESEGGGSGGFLDEAEDDDDDDEATEKEDDDDDEEEDEDEDEDDDDDDEDDE